MRSFSTVFFMVTASGVVLGYGTGSDHRSVELSSGLVGASKGHGSVPGEAARGGGVRRPLQDSGDGLGSVPGGNGMMGGGGGLRRGVGGGVIGGGGTGGPIGGPGASWKWWRYHELSDKEILDHLVHSQRYDRREIPPSDGPLQINVSLSILSLDPPVADGHHSAYSAPDMTFSMGFLLQQAWFDPRLIHNDNQRTPTTYLNGLHHAGDLWLPEMYLAGGGGGRGGGHGRVGDDNSNDRLAATAINIYGNGSVLYTMRRQMNLRCESSDPGNFPFDKTLCSFRLESVSYTRDEIEWRWSIGDRMVAPAALRRRSPHKGSSGRMTKIQTSECSTWKGGGAAQDGGGNHSCLELQIRFSRSLQPFMLNIVFPDLIFVSSSFLAFWVDGQTSLIARIVFATLSLFNFFVCSAGSRRITSDTVTAVQSWHLMTMFFVFASCSQFVVVNFFNRKSDQKNRGGQRSNSISGGCGSKKKDHYGFNNDFRRPHDLGDVTGGGATIRASLSGSHYHRHSLRNAASVESCKCIVSIANTAGTASPSTAGADVESPFSRANTHATDFNMPEPLEDTRSISSDFFDNKVFKDEFSVSTAQRRSKSGKNPQRQFRLHSGGNGKSVASKIDRMSRVLFPSVYIFSVLAFFCKHLES